MFRGAQRVLYMLLDSFVLLRLIHACFLSPAAAFSPFDCCPYFFPLLPRSPAVKLLLFPTARCPPFADSSEMSFPGSAFESERERESSRLPNRQAVTDAAAGMLGVHSCLPLLSYNFLSS